ncbi:MAG TPA: gluconate 2-dehydrogenase subunit 3 family protein [Ktedonobacterales bacterium]|nr:gluconate 2-dehydrogenase subunit 3 family protein [Ktedonobacterales bacterium]
MSLHTPQHNARSPLTDEDAIATDPRSRLPINPRTGAPLAPRAQPGYYLGFSTLAQQKFWDEATRRVVLKRVNDPPPICFFTPQEAELMQAVIDRVLPQDDRDDDHKIPVLNAIDDRLYHNRIDGYRYEDMPPDTEAHRLGLRAINAIAIAVYGQPFVELSPDLQDRILQSIHDGEPHAAHDIWARMSCQRYWMLLVQDCIEGYYAHPWAWDEIGFGGPAYPRGYMRLEHGLPEPWEANEKRYEWSGPRWSASNNYWPIGSEHGAATPSQEGTH